MLHDRRAKIVQMISIDKMVKVSHLTELFHVSIETVRRDLEYLEQKGYLNRVYGGAVAKNMFGMEPGYPFSQVQNFMQKAEIGEAACDLVKDGDTILIDIGSTALEFAKCIKGKKRLTVLTNSIQIAMTLVEDPNIRMILMGGEVRRGEYSTFGFMTEEAMDLFHVDKAFLGIGGITKECITDYHMEEANFKRHMLKRTDCVIGLADASKFGIIAWNRVCNTKEIQILVTDSKAPLDYVQEFENTGLQVILPTNEEIRYKIGV